MKKLLASLITLILLVSCCLIAAFPTSAVDVNYDDFDIVDGVIIEYLGAGGEVVIPSYDADGNEVTKIDTRAFYGNTDVTAVYICEGILEIGSECFEGCAQLQEVSLPYSLEKLGDYSPFRKTSVASLIVPGNVKVIPSDLVVGISVEQGGTGVSFSDLIISPGVEEVRAGALYCSAQELIFPDTVCVIEGTAWLYAKKDISLYICNPDCQIGGLQQERQAYKPNSTQTYTYTRNAPIVLMWDSQATVKIYADRDKATEIKDTVNEWRSEFPDAKIEFRGMDADKLQEKNEYCKTNGTVAPTKWVMEKDGSIKSEDKESSTTSGDDDNTKKNNNKNTQTSNGLDTKTLIIIIASAFGGLILIIVIVVVVLVVVNNNKKKKKAARRAAKKKAAEAKAAAEAEVPTGENFEEAPAEEVTEEPADTEDKKDEE